MSALHQPSFHPRCRGLCSSFCAVQLKRPLSCLISVMLFLINPRHSAMGRTSVTVFFFPNLAVCWVISVSVDTPSAPPEASCNDLEHCQQAGHSCRCWRMREYNGYVLVGCQTNTQTYDAGSDSALKGSGSDRVSWEGFSELVEFEQRLE